MRYGVTSHAALIVIFSIITIFVIMRQLLAESWNGMYAMSDFMAGFFLIFGTFKLIDLSGFVIAYKRYNLVAEHIALYAYAVPFIQLSLGLAYLMHSYPLLSNFINFLIMTIGFFSVLIKLVQRDIIPCACLGTLFQHPLSILSLVENALMVAMAIGMTLYHL